MSFPPESFPVPCLSRVSARFLLFAWLVLHCTSLPHFIDISFSFFAVMKLIFDILYPIILLEKVNRKYEKIVINRNNDIPISWMTYQRLISADSPSMVRSMDSVIYVSLQWVFNFGSMTNTTCFTAIGNCETSSQLPIYPFCNLPVGDWHFRLRSFTLFALDMTLNNHTTFL